MDSTSFRQLRRNARIRFVQYLYAWDFQGESLGQVVESVEALLLDWGASRVALGSFNPDLDRPYLGHLLSNIERARPQLDIVLSPLVPRPLEAIGAIERSILRLGALELGPPFNLPSKVAINEAIEISKSFGASDSFRFINGVLHQVAQLRSVVGNGR